MRNSPSILLISVVVAVLAGSTTWSSAAEAQVMGPGKLQQGSYAALEAVAEISAGDAVAGLPSMGSPTVNENIPTEQFIAGDYTLNEPFVLGEQTIEFIQTVATTVVDTTMEVFNYFFAN